MQKTRLLLSVLVLALVCCGCNRNTRFQRTIGLMRAEKLELENEYFRLKADYDRALEQLAQNGFAPSYMAPGVIYESRPPGRNEPANDAPTNDALDQELKIEAPEIIDGDESFQNSTDSSGLSSGTLAYAPTPAEPDPRLLARFIQSIEVDQLAAANLRNGIKLLVRPLDGRGDIIPISGDLDIQLFDRLANTREAIGQWNLAESRVAGLVRDKLGEQPGIHLNLPWREDFAQRSRMLLDLQFRTSDRRIIRQQLPLILDGTTGHAERDDTGIVVELGDELKFDTETNDAGKQHVADLRLQNGAGQPKRPQWKPTR